MEMYINTPGIKAASDTPRKKRPSMSNGKILTHAIRNVIQPLSEEQKVGERERERESERGAGAVRVSLKV